MPDSRLASVALIKITKNIKFIFFKKVSKMSLFSDLPQKDDRKKNSKTHFFEIFESLKNQKNEIPIRIGHNPCVLAVFLVF